MPEPQLAGPAARQERPSETDRTADGQSRRAIEALRIGIGVAWAFNLVFILLPANQFFPTFGSTAASFGPTSPGGAGFASFVAAEPLVFSILIAGVTGYLAFAFITGLTTRVACVVGFAFNVLLFYTQFGQVAVVPGGTDIGPQPLYLLVYVILILGHAGRRYSLDAWTRSVAHRHRTIAPAV